MAWGKAHYIPVNAGAARVWDYLRLMRLPNVFTALADVTMGYLFVHHTLLPLGTFAWLAAASALIYSAGMVLNDVWDVERDREERPHRPLPAGRIAWRSARRWGGGLLVAGVICGTVAGLQAATPVASPWRSGLVVTLLAACVIAYDFGVKRSALGPVAMGACRFLNVLLGMSVAPSWPAPLAVLGFGLPQWLAAGGIGLYITGVTWFARTEAHVSSRWSLGGGCVVLAGGLGLLGLLPGHLPRDLGHRLIDDQAWLLLLGVVALVIVRRCMLAIADPSPRRVQEAVRNCLWSLIVLDATVALLVSHPAWSLVIVSYLLPTVVLGQWIEST